MQLPSPSFDEDPSLICPLLSGPISILELPRRMARKHKPEEIIGKPREAEIVLARGGTLVDACRRIGVTEQSHYRWREE